MSTEILISDDHEYLPWYRDKNILVYKNGDIYDKEKEKFMKKIFIEGKNHVLLTGNFYKRHYQGEKLTPVDEMVAITFIGPANGRRIFHHDFDNKNDHYDNLEWLYWKEIKVREGKVKLDKIMENDTERELEYKPWPKNENYLIFNDGRIFSLFLGDFMYLCVTNGYKAVKMIKSDTLKSVEVRINIIVAKLFVDNPKPDEYNIVDHIDRNKFNNHFKNLRWTDRAGNYENCEKKITSRFIPVDQYTIKNKFIKSFTNITQASKESGCNFHSIKKCARGDKEYTTSKNDDKDYIWKFPEDYNEPEKVDPPEDGIYMEGFDRLYLLSPSRQQIYSLFRKNYMIMQQDHKGYKRLILRKNNESKDFYLHRLLAINCLKDTRPDNYEDFIVNHKNGVIDDNKLSNLEWINYKQNSLHSARVLCQGFGKKIKAEHPDTGDIIGRYPNMAFAEEKLKLTKGAISKAINKYQGFYKDEYVFSLDEDYDEEYDFEDEELYQEYKSKTVLEIIDYIENEQENQEDKYKEDFRHSFGGKSIIMINIETKEYQKFPSITIAGEILKTCIGNITYNLKKETRIFDQKYKFYYIDENFNLEETIAKLDMKNFRKSINGFGDGVRVYTIHGDFIEKYNSVNKVVKTKQIPKDRFYFHLKYNNPEVRNIEEFKVYNKKIYIYDNDNLNDEDNLFDIYD